MRNHDALAEDAGSLAGLHNKARNSRGALLEYTGFYLMYLAGAARTR